MEPSLAPFETLVAQLYKSLDPADDKEDSPFSFIRLASVLFYRSVTKPLKKTLLSSFKRYLHAFLKCL